MKMFFQNLKVALRNLMKYKVQTILSIVSIAIGIVTLSLAFSVMTRFRLPSLLSQPYHDRAYEVFFKQIGEEEDVRISLDAFKALKRDGGPRSAEQIAMLNASGTFPDVEFHLMDSTVRKGNIEGGFFDPEYSLYAGFRSAVTGEKVKRLKKGEAIINERLAKDLFRDADPIGAVQTMSNYVMPIPITIVDVYEEPSFFDPNYYKRQFLFCIEDDIEDYDSEEFLSFQKVYVVLKEGSTEKELATEINTRLKSFGLEVQLKKALQDKDVNRYIVIHILVYILSSLLLVAAIIGFLRMQIQLFWLRRREISLRIVNGAKRMQLFWLLVTEVLITIVLSIGLSIILGYQLEDFLGRNVDLFPLYDLMIRNLWFYSVCTGGTLLLICGLVAWIVIQRVCSSRHGLAQNMRRSRTHLFRDIMLCVQIAICIVLVSFTFMLINGGKKLLEAYNVPENDSFYKECLLVWPQGMTDPMRFLEEIDSLPELDRKVSWIGEDYQIADVEFVDNPKAEEKFKNWAMEITGVPDSTLLSVRGIEVEWFNGDIDRNNCVLIGEDRYSELKEYGLLKNNTLTFNKWGREIYCYPVGGIIKKIPYMSQTMTYIVISPRYNDSSRGSRCYMLIPKPGKGKTLARGVYEICDRLESGKMGAGTSVMNYRSRWNSSPDSVETVRVLGWILATVSLIICAMSIFSTILLDTRSRRKEVAIRKVNGAKSKDIYRIFCRVYVVLFVLSGIIAVPVCVMFNNFVDNYIKNLRLEVVLSPFWPIVFGILVVAILIFAIVGWQTGRVLKADPAKIISKD